MVLLPFQTVGKILWNNDGGELLNEGIRMVGLGVTEIFVTGFGESTNEGNSEVAMERVFGKVEERWSDLSDDYGLQGVE